MPEDVISGLRHQLANVQASIQIADDAVTRTIAEITSLQHARLVDREERIAEKQEHLVKLDQHLFKLREQEANISQRLPPT